MPSLKLISELSAIMTGIAALIALGIAYKTALIAKRSLALQSRPFMDVRFCRNDSEDAILSTLRKENKEPYFRIINSGSSPGIITSLTREWYLFRKSDPAFGQHVRKSEGRTRKECYIAVGSHSETNEISSYLKYYTDRNFDVDPQDILEPNRQFLFFVLTVEFKSADSIETFNARFTFVLNNDRLNLAFPGRNSSFFNVQEQLTYYKPHILSWLRMPTGKSLWRGR